MSEQCQVKYQLNILRGVNLHTIKKECSREAVSNGRCICHLDDPNKPLEPLIEEIKKLSESGQDLDCSYFIFPKVPMRFPVAIRKPTFFVHCRFYGDVSFQGQHFPSYVSFHGAHFFGKADFSDDGNPYEKQTMFHDTVIFTSTEFHKEGLFKSCIFAAPPEFNGTIFHDLANFAWAEIAFSSHLLEFRQVEFRKDAFLDFRISGENIGIAFRYCNLEGLQISSLPRHKTQIEFENIKKWDEKRKWYQVRRLKIRDEQTLKDNPVKLVDTYRFLEKHFYDKSDYSLASQFYIGQMIALRKDKNYYWPSKVLNWLYQKTSNYGESKRRAILTLFLIWLVFPVFLLMMGMPVSRTSNGQVLVVTVNYGLRCIFDETDWSQFWRDYRSVFCSNLSLSTIDRKHELSPPPDSPQRVLLIVESLINVVLASLVVVAARRRFTPKKPTGI